MVGPGIHKVSPGAVDAQVPPPEITNVAKMLLLIVTVKLELLKNKLRLVFKTGFVPPVQVKRYTLGRIGLIEVVNCVVLSMEVAIEPENGVKEDPGLI